MKQEVVEKVPKIVADFIEACKIGEYSPFQMIDGKIHKLQDYGYLDDDFDISALYDWYDYTESKDKILARAWVEEYEIEDEKKFYLRATDFDTRICDCFLSKYGNGEISPVWVLKGNTPYHIVEKEEGKEGITYQFTQSEIDKLHDGYEQIEVEE